MVDEATLIVGQITVTNTHTFIQRFRVEDHIFGAGSRRVFSVTGPDLSPSTAITRTTAAPI